MPASSTDSDFWRDRQAARLQFDEQFLPALRALPRARLEPDQLLPTLGRGADQHQQEVDERHARYEYHRGHDHTHHDAGRQHLQGALQRDQASREDRAERDADGRDPLEYRGLVQRHLDQLVVLTPEVLAQATLQRLDLPAVSAALRAVHQPATLAEAEQGRRRLAFDELLDLQLMLGRARLLARHRAGRLAAREPVECRERSRPRPQAHVVGAQLLRESRRKRSELGARQRRQSGIIAPQGGEALASEIGAARVRARQRIVETLAR